MVDVIHESQLLETQTMALSRLRCPEMTPGCDARVSGRDRVRTAENDDPVPMIMVSRDTLKTGGTNGTEVDSRKGTSRLQGPKRPGAM